VGEISMDCDGIDWIRRAEQAYGLIPQRFDLSQDRVGIKISDRNYILVGEETVMIPNDKMIVYESFFKNRMNGSVFPYFFIWMIRIDHRRMIYVDNHYLDRSKFFQDGEYLFIFFLGYSWPTNRLSHPPCWSS